MTGVLPPALARTLSLAPRSTDRCWPDSSSGQRRFAVSRRSMDTRTRRRCFGSCSERGTWTRGDVGAGGRMTSDLSSALGVYTGASRSSARSRISADGRRPMSSFCIPCHGISCEREPPESPVSPDVLARKLERLRRYLDDLATHSGRTAEEVLRDRAAARAGRPGGGGHPVPSTGRSWADSRVVPSRVRAIRSRGPHPRGSGRPVVPSGRAGLRDVAAGPCPGNHAPSPSPGR